MIKVTIELAPFGNEQNKSTLSELIICNTRTKNEEGNFIYSYAGYVDNFGEDEELEGEVSHIRTSNVLCLLHNVLRSEMRKRGSLEPKVEE